MSLQVFLSQLLSSSAQQLNLLALFLALPGSWLLLATRWREQGGWLLAGGQLSATAADGDVTDAATQRLNRFFYRFGLLCLAAALGLSWLSTRL